jgi:NADPH:quinone reductase-like Zn-dependent oxidoreductase
MAFLYSLCYLRRTVTATASTPDKLNWLLSLPAGATHAANYKKENFVDVTNAATGGKGIDLIIDMVGQSHFSRNLDALGVDGRMTMLALMSGLSTFHTHGHHAAWY